MHMIALIAKGLAVGCSIMAGASVSVFFMQDLLTMGTDGPSGAWGNYAFLISDTAVSLLTGFLLGWLLYFCLWECMANWLGSLWMHGKDKFQPKGGNGHAQEAEQTV